MSISIGLYRLALGALLAGTLAVTACDNVSPHGATSSRVSESKPVTTSGTVVFREKSGGFFGILTDNGGQYEPVNLDPQYRADGLRVKLTGYLDDAHLGKHNWGNSITLETVQKQKN